MSYLRDALDIINDDTPVFAFLPVANVIYLLIVEYSDGVFVGGLALTLFSSFLYLLIDQDPDYDDHINSVRVLFVIWALLYAETLRRLFDLLSSNLIMAEILFFISMTFIALVASDKLLKTLDGYDGAI